jgi:DNA polymerase elongation subunit (family B)
LLIDEVVKRIPIKDEQKICDAVDKYVKLKLDPVLQETTDAIAKQLNFYSNGLQFKREAISTVGFWLAPKKYALRVLDMEGVRYSEPDYKVTGIETNKSSTPDVARGWLMECIECILNGGSNEDIRKMVVDYESKFMTLKPHDIAFPRSANNLREYSDPVTIYTKYKACPIAVRASLLYNNQILKLGLQKELQKIEEGDKIKFLYLKTPNTLRENVIAFTDKLPTEFGLDKYVDYKTQFNKVFLDPLAKIMKALGWSIEETNDLSEFF